jgi:hypothetical protein
MYKRVKGLPAALVLMLGFAGAASSGPFDRPLETYGPALNEILQQAGSELRFRLDRCDGVSLTKCRFSSSKVLVSVEGSPMQDGIGRIIIAVDLLRDHPTTLPHMAVVEALVVLTATMMTFDPEVPRVQRDGLVSSLVEAAHGVGHGKGSGISADYLVALEQTGTTLLVITVAPKAQ